MSQFIIQTENLTFRYTTQEGVAPTVLDGVSLSGPVFSRRGAANPELLNLYLSLPRQDGTYRQVTVECILSRAAPSGSYSAFLNIDGRGYLVASGKQAVARFIQDCRPANLS